MFKKIRRWWLLRKAKKLEEKHVPTKEEIKKEHKQFMKTARQLEKEAKKR